MGNEKRLVEQKIKYIKTPKGYKVHIAFPASKKGYTAVSFWKKSSRKKK